MNDQVAYERSIFLRAIEIASAEGRSSFLDAACGDNRRLRDEIEALLGAHARPLGLLDAPDIGRPTVDLPAAHEGRVPSSAPTRSCRRSARAAWAPSTWPSRPTR
jgi:hypothetical protein